MRDTVTPPDAAIRLDHVSKVFGKAGGHAVYRAVDDLNLDVRTGEMLAILGKTGCGKSTIFNMIAGLTEPTSGTVRVGGRDPFADFDRFAAESRSCSRMTACCRGERPFKMSNWDLRCLTCPRRSGDPQPSYG